MAEVKSLTPKNEVKQLRLGLGQVLDYAAMLREAGHEVQPVLAVEQEPSSDRWVRLCEELGVRLVWSEPFST